MSLLERITEAFEAVGADIRKLVTAAQPYSSRAAFMRATIADDVTQVSWRGDDERVFYVVRLTNGPIQQDNGQRWAPTGFPTPEHFGAVGDYYNDSQASADDTAALQALFDWMGSHHCHAVAAKIMGRYRTTSTLVYNGRGKKLEFAVSSQLQSETVSVYQMGVICCDFTTGPGIWAYGNQVSLSGHTVIASATRRAAPASANGAGTPNCGVLIEPPDVEDGEILGVDLYEGACIGHPSGGHLLEGGVTGATLTNCYEAGIPHGPGKSITSGQLSGRTHVGRPGIITIIAGKSFDTGGHGLAIGHPAAASMTPYRVYVVNHEAYRCAKDPAARYAATCDYIVANGSEIHSCAHAGTGDGNVAQHGGLTIGGNGIRHVSGRFISCVGSYVELVQHPGLLADLIELWGSVAVSPNASPPPVFATFAPGVSNVKITPASHDCPAPITDIVVSTTNKSITLVDAKTNKTVRHNTDIEHRGVKVKDKADNVQLYISGGTVEVEGSGVYRLRTEGFAPTDVLENITGGTSGDIILLKLGNSQQTVLLVENTGNLRHDGSANHDLDTATSYAIYIKDDVNWRLVKTAAS